MEMDEIVNSVSVQIQRAIYDAISSQVSYQIQNANMAGSGHVTQKGRNVPAERPETNTEVFRGEKARNNSKSELVQNCLNDGITENAYDSYICGFIHDSPLISVNYFNREKLQVQHRVPRWLIPDSFNFFEFQFFLQLTKTLFLKA